MTTPRLTSASLMSMLEDIERRFPVVDWKIGGMRIWPLVRVRWFFTIWAAAYGAKDAGSSRLRIVLRRLGGIASGRIRNLWARAADARAAATLTPCDALFLSDGVSFVERDGRQYERFCDPIMEMLRKRGHSTLLLTPSHRYLRPRATPSVFVQPMLDIAQLAGVSLGRELAAAASLPQLDEVRAVLATQGWDHASMSRERLAEAAGRVESLARAFDGILERTRPKLAFIVSYYSMEGAGFALACRRRRIPLVDIQHGVEGPLHPAYGLPRAPSEGFEVVPDRFWVWSREEAETIAAWAGGSVHRAAVGGNRWLDRWLEEDDAEIRAINAKVQALRAGFGKARVVLVTLQWGLSPDEQVRPLRELIGHAAADWVWWVRLHPLMRPQRVQIAAELAGTSGANVLLEEPSDLPLYGLLRHVDVHLTHSSSVVLEALKFGVGSVLTSRYGSEVFPHQIEAGHCALADGDAGQVLAALAAQAQRRQPVQPTSEGAEAALQSLLADAGLPQARTA